MINSNNNDSLSLDFSGGKFITSATGILRIIVIVSISIYVQRRILNLYPRLL